MFRANFVRGLLVLDGEEDEGTTVSGIASITRSCNDITICDRKLIAAIAKPFIKL